MKKKYSFRSLFCCLLFLSFSSPLFAQLQIDSVVPTPATCEKNGEILVNASGGNGPYTYALIAPSPTERPNQSSNTFGSLLPGEYTVQVTDSSNPPEVVTTTVIVEDQYTEPVIQSVDTTASSCPNATDGSATINLNNATATPVNYTLYEGITATGTPVGGPQTSTVFNNLETGQYTVLAVDDCGIQDPFTFLVETVDEFTTAYDGQEYDCNQAQIIMSTFSGGKAPYSYVVTSGGSTFSSGAYTPTEQVPVPYNTNFTVTFTDDCGTESVVSGGPILKEPISAVTTTGNCNDGLTTAVEFNSGGFACDNVQYCYRVQGSGASFTCSSSNSFGSLPVGNYEYQITDTCCGEIYTDTFTVANPSPSVVPSRYEEGCLPGTNTFLLDLLNFGDNINVEIISATPDHNYTDQDGNPQTATPNFPQGSSNFVLDGNSLQLGSVPAGNYSFRITDDCGNNFVFNAPVPTSAVIQPDFFVEYTPVCSGNTELNFGVRNAGGVDTDNTADGSSIVVRDASGGELYRRDQVRVADSNTLSVAPGTYTVEFTMATSATNTLYGTCPDTYTETIEVTNVPAPDLSVTEFYRCSGSDATIVAGVTGGAAPYSYRIRELGETTWGTAQSSPLFTGLDDTKTYEIEVLDSCSRNNIKQVEAGGILDDPAIGAEYDCVSSGGSATKVDLSATEVFGANYEWRDSAGVLVGNTRKLTIDPIDVGETYTVTVSIPSAAGTCVAASSSISITTDNCLLLPIQLSDFSADLRDDFVQLNWTTLSEIDHDYFKLERSADATNWTSIYTEIGRGGDAPYTYRYDDHEVKLGVNYYRLKIVSTNSEIEYSPVLSVFKELPDGVVSVSPNPVSNGTATVFLPNNIEADEYSVYSMNGLKVAEADIAGKQFLIFTSELSKGVYYILLNKDGQRVHKPLKIVVL